MHQSPNYRNSFLKSFAKIFSCFKSHSNRLSYIYIILVVINILQYLYVNSHFQSLSSSSDEQNSTSTMQQTTSDYYQCYNSFDSSKSISSQYPGTCMSDTNINGFSVLKLFFIIDASFNFLSICVIQLKKRYKFLQFFNTRLYKTSCNTLENVLQFLIIYFGDDKLTLISSVLIFTKNFLTVQYSFRRGRLVQFLILTAGTLTNAILRKWDALLVVAVGLAVAETFASAKETLTRFEQIILSHEDEFLHRNDEPYCSGRIQQRLSNNKDEENQTSNIIHRSSKKLSINKQSSSKKRIENNESPSKIVKGNFEQGSSNWERTHLKYESKNQFLTDISKANLPLNGKQRGVGMKSYSMKPNLEKKSSLDNMISPNHTQIKCHMKECERGKAEHYHNNNEYEYPHQQSNVVIRGDQSFSCSSIYEHTQKGKNANFIRYKTTSPGLKNDGTVSIDQSKSKHQYVSSAGLIPSAGTYTIQSGKSLPKSHQKIGKKPALNLSDIKALKFNEKFKFYKSKTSSKSKIRSIGGGSINSRIKIESEEIGSQNGRRNYVYSSQTIQLKSKHQHSPKDIEPIESLSPTNNGVFHEDLKNQFSTKHVQNSSSKLLYQLNDLHSNANFMNSNHNFDGKVSASSTIIQDRPHILKTATIRGKIDDERINRGKFDSIDSGDDSSLHNNNNNENKVHLKDFYGMFFQIVSEGIVLFNFENGDININNTLKRLLNCHNEKDCIEILFSLKNASLQPLNNSTEGIRSTVFQNGNEDGAGQNSNPPEMNPIHSSFMNINSYMYDNSLFTASKNRTVDEQTNSNNQKVPTQKSQKSINIHSNYTYQNQITNSNNIQNDDVFSQIKRRHSTSSYHKTNTLISKKTTRFQYKRDEEEEDELNSSAEVENSPVYQNKYKINSGILSSNIIGVQFQMEGVQASSIIQNNIIREIEVPQKTVKINKTTQAQKQPDSGLYIEESLNQEYIGSNNMFDKQLQQQLQILSNTNNECQNEYALKEEDELKLKRKELLGSGITAAASPQQQQTHHHTQSHHSKQSRQKQSTNRPFKKIIYTVAKEFTVKDQFEKIEEDMREYQNESRYEMLGHHIKMLCKLDQKALSPLKSQNLDSFPTATGNQQTTTPTQQGGGIQNMTQQANYYSSMSYNQMSSLNPFNHQNSMHLDGLKNRKTSRFSNLSALNAFQQQSTVQFIQQQIQQKEQQQQNQMLSNKNEDKKIIEITFIPCYVNKQKCLVMIVKDVSHFNSLKVLKEMNENRSRMLNYVVHEIRSPLSSIMNYLHSSVESLTRELYDQFIDPALSSAQMLNVLIQDLLDMAQMKAGKYRLNIRPFRIENLIDDVKRTMRVIVKQKSQDITLESYIDPQINSEIYSDQLRIKQILINLIGNAIKFTEEGSIKIEVTQVENRILKFSVRDTGIGITDDQKKKLFSEFSKIETTQTDILNPKGVGLGLVISNTLAKSLAPKHMSSGLEISPGKSKGSEFYFHILDFQMVNNTTLQHNMSSIVNMSEQNILTRTNKFTAATQKLNNPSILNNTAPFNYSSQMSPQLKQLANQQYSSQQSNTQLINSLFPYTKGASNQDVVIDQDQLVLESDNNNNNMSSNNNNLTHKRTMHRSLSSSASSNSSSSPSSRKHSVSIPFDEEGIDLSIQNIAPKFKKNMGEQLTQQLQQQVNQMRYLSSSAVGSDYNKNADISLQNNSMNNFVNNNNYSFIQNSFNRDMNKPHSQVVNQLGQQNQQAQHSQQIPSSYFNFDDNAQQNTASLPVQSVQSLKFGQFQSLQHNSQASSSLQQDGLLNIPPNLEMKQKLKKKCYCSNILVVDDDAFVCAPLQQLISQTAKQSCDKATSCDLCMKLINAKYQSNQCCPTYHLILLDLNMFPSKDGFETLIEIQKFHSQYKLVMPKVVACTGEADEEKKHQCLLAGFNDVVEKPIQPDELKQILQTYLPHHQEKQQQQQTLIFQNTMSQLSFNQMQVM